MITDPGPFTLNVVSSADLSQILSQGASLQFAAGTESVVPTDGILSVGQDTNEAATDRLFIGLLLSREREREMPRRMRSSKWPPDWSAPLGVDRISRCFDHLPGVLILELHGAEIAKGRVQPP